MDLDTFAELGRRLTSGPSRGRYFDDHYAMGAKDNSTQADGGEFEDMASFACAGPELPEASVIQAPPYAVSPGNNRQESGDLVMKMPSALPELLRPARLGAAGEAKRR